MTQPTRPTDIFSAQGQSMAIKIGSVNVIWRNLDIYAFTGEIVETQRTSETTVTGNMNAPISQISSRTDHYTHLFLRAPDGRELDVNFESRIGFRAGQTATAIWASSAGPDSGKYIAAYNHTSGQINTIRKGNNDMACIPFYNYIGIVAIFYGMFGFMAHGLIPKLIQFGIGFGYIAFMLLCQKKLMDGTNALMRTYTP
jgi:hypothetical protein